MADATIDTLVIEVSGDADAAHKGIDSLVASLNRLNKALESPTGRLGRLADHVRRLSNAVSGLNVQKLLQLSGLKIGKKSVDNLAGLGAAVGTIPEDAASKVEAIAGLSALTGVSLSKTLPNNLPLLAQAVAQMPTDTRSRLEGLSALSSLGGVTVSSTVGKNLKAVAEAARELPEGASETLGDLSRALSGFSALQDVSITKFANSLKRLPEAMREFEGFDVTAFSEATGRLNAQLGPLAANVRAVADAVNLLPPSYRTAGRAAATVASANRQLGRQFDETGRKADTLGDRLRRLFSVAKVVAFARVVVGKLGECVKALSDYVEDMNLYAASMGRFGEEGEDFARKVQTLLGIDSGEWMRFQGVLMSIGTGFGIANDRMATMSQNMTQLGYDISSFYNLDVDESMRKVQSGFAGELEPMRRIGYDLSVARMEVERVNLGIEKQVADMTQAEKAALRYHLMMTQLGQVHGDMARTIKSPANQLRVLKAQFTLAARAIGNVFIPVLNAMLPYVIAAAKAVQMLANTIASLLARFGIEMPTFEVDYSGLDAAGVAGDLSGIADAEGDVGDSAEEAKKKVDELKRSVMGFDELNKLVDNTSSDTASSKDDGSGVGAGSILDQIPLDTYDFLKDLNDHLAATTDELAQKIMGLLPILGAVASGLAAWRIADRLLPDTLKGIDRFRALAGVVMAAAGAVLYLTGIWDMWQNGMDLSNTLQVLGGMALVVGGLALAFGSVAAGVGALVTGVGLFATALHDALTSGIDWFNVLGMTVGGTAAVLGSFFAGLTGVVTALVGAVAGGIMIVTGFVDAWNDGVDWESLALMVGGTLVSAFAMFMGGLGPVAIAIAGVVGGVATLTASLADMWRNGFSPEAFAGAEAGFGLVGAAIGLLVGGPVGALVGALVGLGVGVIATIATDWEGFAAWFSELWAGIVESTRGVWEPVADWFAENVATPVTEAFEAVGTFLSGLWESAVGAAREWWSGVPAWFRDHVVQPFWDVWLPIEVWFSALWASVSATAEAVWHNLGVFVGGVVQIVQRAWELLGDWFDQHVWQPVARLAQRACDDVEQAVRRLWDKVTQLWGIVSEWFDQHVAQPLDRAFSAVWDKLGTGAGRAWEAIKEAFREFGSYFGGIVSDAWRQIKEAFQWGGRIFDGVVGAIERAFRSMMNGLIEGLNWAISQPFDGLNSILSAMRGWEILGIRPFADFWNVPVPRIPYLAGGGQVGEGQLFVAREGGPELVGTMGGRSTVANNEQIVEGIEGGVMRGVLKAIAMGGPGERGEQVIEIPLIIGYEELGRAAYRGRLDLVRRGVIEPEFV